MIGVRLGVGHNFSGGFDSSASAFFAATGITGTTEQQAVNTLVTSLKSAGLWSKMKAVYPFVTDNRNLLSYTEDFGNGYWGKVRTTITANDTTAPNGTVTADKLQSTAGVGQAVEIFQSFTTTAQPYTASVYLKQGSGATDMNRLDVYDIGSSTYKVRVTLNFSTGVITQSVGTGATVQNVGNGWYRISAPFTALAGLTYVYVGSDGTYFASGTYSYAWGAQLELGSTATTYQPIATTQQSYISSQFKYNLINPVDSDAAFRGVFNGGWTFSNQGATPNGTNGYMDTKLNISTNLSLTDTHLSYYSRTNNANTNYGAEIGVLGLYVATSYMLLRTRNDGSGGVSYFTIGNDNGATYSTTNGAGMTIGSATSLTSRKLYKNSTLVATQTISNIGTLPNLNAAIGQNSTGSYSSNQSSFASIGQGLTDTEAAALYNAVQTFNTSLSRQV